MRQPARRSKGRQEAARQAASGTAKRAAASALATHLCRSRSIHCTHRIDCSQQSQLPFPPPAQRARPLHRLYLEHWTRRRLDWLRGSAWASVQTGPACTGATPALREGSGKETPNGSGSATQALAEPEEAVFADVAAQGHHADAPQQEVEESAMRPPDVAFMTLWASNSHSWQSPENLWPGEVGLPWRLPPHSEQQDRVNSGPQCGAGSVSI